MRLKGHAEKGEFNKNTLEIENVKGNTHNYKLWGWQQMSRMKNEKWVYCVSETIDNSHSIIISWQTRHENN